MKIKLTALAATVFLFVSCNNNKSKDTVTVQHEDGKGQTTIDVSDMKDVAADMEKTKEKLANTTPLGAEEMKALLPEQLAGARRVELDVQPAMGTNVAQGRYQVTDTSWVEISIVDCAGPAGSGLFATQYLGMMNVQDEDEDEYTRTVEYKGGKAFENCQKKRLECSLTWFTKNRFLVSINSQFVGIDAVRKVGDALEL